jgi:acyl-CoA reductase-like NAD-dependent aldehyde dehydrogenase
LLKVPVASQDDLNKAVAAGQKAFQSWSRTPIEKRKELMLKFVDLYSNYEKEMTDLLCKVLFSLLADHWQAC